MKPAKVNLFRSEKMTFCQIFFETQTAYYYVREFGELAVVHFIDLNDQLPTNKRKFIKNIVWCDDLERKLRYIEEQLVKEDELPNVASVKEISAPDPRDFVELENDISQYQARLVESTNNLKNLKTSYNKLVECKQMMRVLETYLAKDGISATQLTNKQMNSDANLNFITGTIENSDLAFFEQLLWRTTKGNVLIRYTDLGQILIDYETNKSIYKSAFIIFVQGDLLLNKVNKICEAMKTNTYTYPCDSVERNQLIVGLTTRISDMEAVINQALYQREIIISNICINFSTWKVKALKIKNIYATMNLFSYDSKSVGLVAEGWIPDKDVSSVKETIGITMEMSNSNVPVVFNPVKTDEDPPTYFQVTSFEKPFQEIIDSFGVANYREANPALFTITSFPFLFAIMFSDCCHGLMLTLIGLWLVLDKKFISKNKNSEIFGIIISGRYIILMMGIFSLYTGLLFNEAFSRSINIFGSMWKLPNATTTPININQLNQMVNAKINKSVELDPKVFAKSPYLLGLDPIWSISENYIIVTNGFKMKFSIIIGVTHMIFGLCIALSNYIYRKDKVGILLEFIPGIIFFGSIFGYMVILIFYKWIYISLELKYQPSILLTMIGMFLNFGKTITPDNLLYTNQMYVEMIIVIMAFISIPLMLFGKPVAVALKKNNQLKEHVSSLIRGVTSGQTGYVRLPSDIRQQMDDSFPPTFEGSSLIGDPNSQKGFESSEPTNYGTQHSMPTTTDKLIDFDNDSTIVCDSEPDADTINVSHIAFHRRQKNGNGHYANMGHDAEGFGEDLVIQGIHTIEFVLGSVSNTASYLRLWALSLAHSQLSDVLWTMSMRIGFRYSNSPIGSISLAAGFLIFISLTFGILILMEGMSAFLHTLRLHWVEFQGKFYSGSGYAFRPFDLSKVLKQPS